MTDLNKWGSFHHIILVHSFADYHLPPQNHFSTGSGSGLWDACVNLFNWKTSTSTSISTSTNTNTNTNSSTGWLVRSDRSMIVQLKCMDIVAAAGECTMEAKRCKHQQWQAVQADCVNWEMQRQRQRQMQLQAQASTSTSTSSTSTASSRSSSSNSDSIFCGGNTLPEYRSNAVDTARQLQATFCCCCREVFESQNQKGNGNGNGLDDAKKQSMFETQTKHCKGEPRCAAVYSQKGQGQGQGQGQGRGEPDPAWLRDHCREYRGCKTYLQL